MIDKIYESTI